MAITNVTIRQQLAERAAGNVSGKKRLLTKIENANRLEDAMATTYIQDAVFSHMGAQPNSSAKLARMTLT